MTQDDLPEVYLFNTDFVENVYFYFKREKISDTYTSSSIKINIDFSNPQVYRREKTSSIYLEFHNYDKQIELFNYNYNEVYDIESNDDYLNKQFTVLKRFLEDDNE